MKPLLENSIKDYFKPNREVIAVYLFGSHAKKKSHPGSDIDIGILIQHRSMPEQIKMRNQIQVELSRILRKDIHLVVLNSAPESLLSQVFKSGSCVLCNDQRKLSEILMIMYSKIADFGYYLVRMQDGFVQQMMRG